MARYPCDPLLTAIDPVNLIYTEKLEAVSMVIKSTPPGPRADDVSLDRQLLLTDRPILDAHSTRTAYDAWRHRPQIEHTYRCDQERGLEVEDMPVHTLERMHRLFALVLIAALFVYYIAHVWLEPAVRWLLELGDKLHHKLDAVFVIVATLAFAARFPFPRECLICGQSPGKSN